MEPLNHCIITEETFVKSVKYHTLANLVTFDQNCPIQLWCKFRERRINNVDYDHLPPAFTYIL